MTGLCLDKPVFIFDKLIFLFYNSGMKRIILGFALLLFFSPAFAAGGNDDTQKIFERRDIYIMPAPEDEGQMQDDCDTLIRTRGVGQFCLPNDNEEESEIQKDEGKDANVSHYGRNLDLLISLESSDKSVSEKSINASDTVVNKTSGLKPAADTQSAQTTKQLYAQALALYSDNSTDAALETFKQIPEYARTTTAWTLMGNILADMGKKDEAIFMYRRAISVDNDNYKAHYNLGNMYLEDDIFYTAIDCYKDAIKANMSFPYAYYNLGIAYVKTGNLKKAKSAFLNALEYKKDVADFHYNLAYVYKLMNKPKLAQTYLDNYNKLMGY